MLEYDEKRNFIRMSVNCEINYKLTDSDQTYQGRCTSLSGAGLAFIADREFEQGKSMEVNVIPENSITPPMTAYVEIVRSIKLDSGQYEIGAQIKSIKNT